MKNLKILTLACVAFLASCNSNTPKNKTVKDTTGATTVSTNSVDIKSDSSANAGIARSANFEIQIPQGWESKQDSMNGRNLFFLLAPKEMNYQTNMNVLKDPMKGESLDDYIKISLGKMQSMKITMGATGEMQAGGITGKYLKYIYDTNGRTIAVKSYVFPKNDTAYIVTATTLPQLGKKYEPVFDKAVGSLKIH